MNLEKAIELAQEALHDSDHTLDKDLQTAILILITSSRSLIQLQQAFEEANRRLQ